MSGLDLQYKQLQAAKSQVNGEQLDAAKKSLTQQYSLKDFNNGNQDNSQNPYSYQTQNRMFASTTLYDRNSITNIPQRASKLQKSVILFDSGVTLGDLEQLKITNMKDIKKESQIIDQEIGNVDDKKFVSLIADEQVHKRLSSRLSESQRIPRSSLKAINKQDSLIALDSTQKQMDQITLQEQHSIKSTTQFRNNKNPDISTIQEQSEELVCDTQDKCKQIEIQDQQNSAKQSSSLSSGIEQESDEDNQVVEDEHISEENKIQKIPVMRVAEKNVVTYKPNETSIFQFQIGPLREMKGYLKKRSPQYIVGWQKRWCVLKDQKLFYYKNEKSYRQYGVICFNIISCRAEIKVGQKSKTKKLFLTFPNHEKTFTFKSDDPAQPIEKWYNEIVNHIVQSQGYKNNLRLEAKRFWRDDRISQKEFIEQADTGDLILFRGKSIEARLQRAFTGSDFDHVALVLKYSTSDLFVMEALGGKIGKVILFRWNLFQKNRWYEFYDKIVYRKLNMNRTNQALTNLEKFIQYALNKKYKFTLGKIMRKKTSHKEESDQNEDRTFFCSELIAACYKKLAILKEETACSSYLPGHFSLEKDLQLKNNAQLQYEQVIDFLMY
ncbi:hypothetical protein ABPG72_003355 [Tetrahymena utriculariae]